MKSTYTKWEGISNLQSNMMTGYKQESIKVTMAMSSAVCQLPRQRVEQMTHSVAGFPVKKKGNACGEFPIIK